MPEPGKKRRRPLTCCLKSVVLFTLGGALVGGAAIAVVGWTYLWPIPIVSGSMEPTFATGEWVLLDKAAYGERIPFTDDYPGGRHLPDRGDLVALTVPIDDHTYVRRVVGLPGDTVFVRDGLLEVNGEVVEYDADGSMAGMLYPTTYEISLESGGGVDQDLTTIADGRFFALSDNRSSSSDCRTWGELPLDRIEGEVFAIVYRPDVGLVWEVE